MSFTVSDIRPVIAKAAKICSEDARVFDYLNEACERLLWKGVYKNTWGRFSVAITNKQITWPREIESILSCAVDTIPVTIRNGWYEFLQQGPGVMDDAPGSQQTLIDRPNSPLITDFEGAQSLRLYTSLVTDDAKLVLIEGLDSNGDAVRSEYPASSGSYINGVYVALDSTPYATVPGTWTAVTAVQKVVTNGAVTLKAYDGVTETEIAVWQPGDTRPDFRRSILPGVTDGVELTLTVIGKLRQLTLRNETDWVIPANRAALRQMTTAIWFEENEDPKSSLVYDQMAKKSLEEQLSASNGGARPEINQGYSRNQGVCGVQQVQ